MGDFQPQLFMKRKCSDKRKIFNKFFFFGGGANCNCHLFSPRATKQLANAADDVVECSRGRCLKTVWKRRQSLMTTLSLQLTARL